MFSVDYFAVLIFNLLYVVSASGRKMFCVVLAIHRAYILRVSVVLYNTPCVFRTHTVEIALHTDTSVYLVRLLPKLMQP